MEIVPTSILALLVILVLFANSPHRGLWAFMVLTPFGAAAAFNLPAVGGASVGVMDIGAIAIFSIMLLSRDGFSRIVGSLRIGRPGFYLTLLALFAIVSALVFPRLFSGNTEVFAIARDENQTRIMLVPLKATTGNLTQLFRFTLNVLTFLAVATAFRLRPDPRYVLIAMIAATAVHVILGTVDVLSVLTGFSELLDPIRTANYSILAGVRIGGLVRMVGGFPEASSFGYYSLGLFGFWLQYWILTRNKSALLMLALSFAVLVLSTSSASYVAALAFLITGGFITVLRGLEAHVSRRTMSLAITGALVALAISVLLFASYQLVDSISQYFDEILFDKVRSSSGVERSSWNAQAWQNYRDTWGLGAGLGSVRASNWLLASLASVGLIGTGLYLAFLVSVMRLSTCSENFNRDACISSLKSGCLAMLMSAMLTSATPDLGIFFFALAGLATGLSRGGEIESIA
ncbi:MAG: hypothetical protein GXP05_06845 [Alphaproteobacteria bacterium]|nr:hypothetical protein [Alphaproteobacteria bacterium]